MSVYNTQAVEPLHHRRSTDEDEPGPAAGDGGGGYLIAVVITNLTQAIWFAANFALYSGCGSSRPSRLASAYGRLSLIDNNARVSNIARHPVNCVR